MISSALLPPNHEARAFVVVTKLSVHVMHIAVACRGTLSTSEQPLLRLNLSSCRGRLRMEQRRHVTELVAADVGLLEDDVFSLSGYHDDEDALKVDLDAQYLNMHIDALEPLIEPWSRAWLRAAAKPPRSRR